MVVFKFVLLCVLSSSFCRAGVTEIPPESPDGETIIETISDENWMPSNIFDVKTRTKHVTTNLNIRENEIEKDSSSSDLSWNADSSPIFRAIRDFIFQAGDELERMDQSEDPTDEIVKILGKGLIEATTMFFTQSDNEPLVTSEKPEAFQKPQKSDKPQMEQISIVKIENEQSDSLLDRIGLNTVSLFDNLSVTNTTIACSNCYDTLEMCIHKCFKDHNCNDVQRTARMCPPPSSRLCNIFTQWSPVDECRVHEDCPSPLLCCSDGCINKCSPGIWRN